jgi:hypothetical protein
VRLLSREICGTDALRDAKGGFSPFVTTASDGRNKPAEGDRCAVGGVVRPYHVSARVTPPLISESIVTPLCAGTGLRRLAIGGARHEILVNAYVFTTGVRPLRGADLRP